MDIGCREIFESYFRSNRNFNKKINNIVMKIGSVGISILKFRSGKKFLRGTDSGTNNTLNIKTLSKAKNIEEKTIIAIGIKLK